MNMISKLRPNQYSRALIVLLVIVDVIAVSLSFNLSLWLQPETELLEFYHPRYAAFVFAWLLLWVIISLFTESYSMNNHRRIKKIFGYTFKLSLLHLPLSASVALLIGLDGLSFTFLADIYLIFIAFSVGIKSSILLINRYIRNLEKNKHRVVIVGYTPSGLNLHRYFTGKSSGYHFAGFFDNNASNPLVMGDIERMKVFCVRENINEIFYALPYDTKLVQEISSFADDNFIRFGILQDIGDVQARTLYSDIYDNDLPVLSLKASAEKHDNIKTSYQKALSVLRSLNL